MSLAISSRLASLERALNWRADQLESPHGATSPSGLSARKLPHNISVCALLRNLREYLLQLCFIYSEFMKETVLKPARTFESQLHIVEIQALGFFQDQPEISLHFSKAWGTRASACFCGWWKAQGQSVDHLPLSDQEEQPKQQDTAVAPVPG